MQMAVIEFARNVLKIKKSQHPVSLIKIAYPVIGLDWMNGTKMVEIIQGTDEKFRWNYAT